MHSFFFPANFIPSFHRHHVGNYDTWLSLEERNLKPVIYLSEHKSVSSKRNAKRHLKLTKNFLPYHHFWKTWSYLWTTDLILWILQLRGQARRAQGWIRMLLNVIDIITLKNWNVFTRIHYKTLTTVFLHFVIPRSCSKFNQVAAHLLLWILQLRGQARRAQG